MSETEAVRSEEPPLLAVIGAAGLCGTYLLEAAQRSPFRVRAVVHGPGGRERVAALGVDETVEADLAEPDAVRQAVKNADSVFMIPPAFHPEEDVFAIRALEAAEHAGARRFVYLSVLHPHTPGLRHHLRKANAEAAVRASDLDWTILQPSMFAQIVLSTWGRAPAAGPVNVPFDVHNKFSFIDLRELAEVGVKVLSEQGHDSATYELAGPTTPTIRPGAPTCGPCGRTTTGTVCEATATFCGCCSAVNPHPSRKRPLRSPREASVSCDVPRPQHRVGAGAWRWRSRQLRNTRPVAAVANPGERLLVLPERQPTGTPRVCRSLITTRATRFSGR